MTGRAVVARGRAVHAVPLRREADTAVDVIAVVQVLGGEAHQRLECACLISPVICVCLRPLSSRTAYMPRLRRSSSLPMPISG